jgi:hypothetical protein
MEGAGTASGDAGAVTVFGGSVCAEGRAQPIENVSPAATIKLHCRTKLVFIFVSLWLRARILVVERSLILHYRLAFSTDYSGRAN